MSLRVQMQEILQQYPFKTKISSGIINGDCNQNNNKNNNKNNNNNTNITTYNKNNECLLVKQELEQFLKVNRLGIAYRFSGESIINSGYQHIDNEINNGYQTIDKPTPLQYFISSMQTTSTKRKKKEIEDIWHCIKLLLQNGALPPSYFKETDDQQPTYCLRIMHEFRKSMFEHISDQNIVYQRLKFFCTSIDRNYALTQEMNIYNDQLQEQITQSIITYNCYDHSIWIMSDLYIEQNIDDGIPEPKLFEFYLEQQYNILHLFDNEQFMPSYDYIKMTMHRIPYKEKEYIIKWLISNELKKRRGFIKYLLPFREFNRIFRMRKVKEFEEILMGIDVGGFGCNFGMDLVDLMLSFVYDDMNYLRYDTIEKDREFVNESLKMYSYLSIKWKQWIFDNYILKIPKDELAKLSSFAYLCYL